MFHPHIVWLEHSVLQKLQCLHSEAQIKSCDYKIMLQPLIPVHFAIIPFLNFGLTYLANTELLGMKYVSVLLIVTKCDSDLFSTLKNDYIREFDILHFWQNLKWVKKAYTAHLHPNLKMAKQSNIKRKVLPSADFSTAVDMKRFENDNVWSPRLLSSCCIFIGMQEQQRVHSMYKCRR